MQGTYSTIIMLGLTTVVPVGSKVMVARAATRTDLQIGVTALDPLVPIWWGKTITLRGTT